MDEEKITKEYVEKVKYDRLVYLFNKLVDDLNSIELRRKVVFDGYTDDTDFYDDTDAENGDTTNVFDIPESEDSHSEEL